MGNADSIPVYAQVKMVAQLATGDEEGAERTAKNFFQGCPGVSQVVSAVQLVSGHADAAVETQKVFVKGMGNAVNNTLNATPVVGHVKAGIHALCDDEEGAKRAFMQANRTTGALAGGIGGFIVGGPIGAAVGGIEGAAATDILQTLASKEPQGYIGAIHQVATSKKKAGSICDLLLLTTSDAAAGYGAGRAYQAYNQKVIRAHVERLHQRQSDAWRSGSVNFGEVRFTRVDTPDMYFPIRVSNSKMGLQHILDQHGSEFAQAGYLNSHEGVLQALSEYMHAENGAGFSNQSAYDYSFGWQIGDRVLVTAFTSKLSEHLMTYTGVISHEIVTAYFTTPANWAKKVAKTLNLYQ